MRIILQRVISSSIYVDNTLISQIGLGLLVFLGIKNGDTLRDTKYMIHKILHLRIFADEQGKMNKSILDIGGGMLLVSQFTLYGECKKGNRPSFTNAMSPEKAKGFYNDFVFLLRQQYTKVEEGVFGACMQINIINDGPVTILLESKE